MAPSVLEMAKELTVALIGAGELPADEMSDYIRKTHQFLMELQVTEGSAARPGLATGVLASSSVVDWKKSITKYTVTCLECGAVFKQLSNRHLRGHDLDGRTYRRKYGIPRTQSLTSRDSRARRQAIVQKSKPWEKSSNYAKTAAATRPTRAQVKQLKTAS